MEKTSEKLDIISGIATFLFIGFLIAAIFAYFYQPIEINYQITGLIFGIVGLCLGVIALAISVITYQKQKHHITKTSLHISP